MRRLAAADDCNLRSLKNLRVTVDVQYDRWVGNFREQVRVARIENREHLVVGRFGPGERAFGRSPVQFTGEVPRDGYERTCGGFDGRAVLQGYRESTYKCREFPRTVGDTCMKRKHATTQSDVQSLVHRAAS